MCVYMYPIKSFRVFSRKLLIIIACSTLCNDITFMYHTLSHAHPHRFYLSPSPPSLSISLSCFACHAADSCPPRSQLSRLRLCRQPPQEGEQEEAQKQKQRQSQDCEQEHGQDQAQ